MVVLTKQLHRSHRAVARRSFSIFAGHLFALPSVVVIFLSTSLLGHLIENPSDPDRSSFTFLVESNLTPDQALALVMDVLVDPP